VRCGGFWLLTSWEFRGFLTRAASQIERSLRTMVTALRRRIAVSFKAIRSKLFLDEPMLPPKNMSADKVGLAAMVCE
jgi:hypothetical protein